ncbi:hypothetical protein E4U43_004331 [Claviceps pusilla]|uniref:Uncharacterized protein n=1 Tax=Claviceps pusilla TaxID=123648 RepID=A0A9P7N3J1_9HYPO|nr:hypothetical protein E4U43_004331 [Claviceps pusilla]
MLKAVTRQSCAVDAKIRAINTQRTDKPPISTAYFFDHLATEQDTAVMVTEADFMAAHEELIPSVSAGELAHYEKVRATFEGIRDKGPSRAAKAAGGGDAGVPVLQDGFSSASSAAAAAASSRPKAMTNSRTQSKASLSKGKGKAIAAADTDGDDEHSGHEMGGASVNGRSKGKGKAVMGFQHGTPSDDEGVY